MRSFVVAGFVVVGLALAGCSDDDNGDSGGSGAGGTPADVNSADAQAYLADLQEAGLGDLFETDEAAVAFVPTACESAVAFQMTPEQLIESGEVSEQAAVALQYCDTELNP
ncbi:MAG: hypothetical protein ACSLFP_04195 [Acidimicrobiales bacterium]